MAGQNLRHDREHQQNAARYVKCQRCGAKVPRRRPREDNVVSEAQAIVAGQGLESFLEAYCVGRALLDAGFEIGDELLSIDDGQAGRAAAWARILAERVCPRVVSPEALPARLRPHLGKPCAMLEAMCMMQLHPVLQRTAIAFSTPADESSRLACGALLGRLRSPDVQEWVSA